MDKVHVRPWSPRLLLELERHSRVVPFLLFALALTTRLIAWPGSDVVDADAATRAMIGESYMLYPAWSSDGVWLPLHFYLNGAFVVICESRVTGPILVNILLASAIVFPLFAFSKRWASPTIALSVVLVVIFNPLVFRNSLQGLSEIPFFFFTVCAFNSLSLALTDPSSRGSRQALLAGLLITIASGMRYEAWLLTIMFLAVLLIQGQWRRSLPFLGTALILPVIWMVTSHIAHGNFLKGLDHMVHWQTTTHHELVAEDELQRRSAFFPLSFVLAISPIAVVLGIWGTSVGFVRDQVTRHEWPWLLLFPFFLIIMIFKARNAELLLQHRFTMTLVLLFIPYLILGFRSIRSMMAIRILALSICTWGSIANAKWADHTWIKGPKGSLLENALGFIRDYTLDQLEPIPRLKNELPHRLLDQLDQYDFDRSLLVLDFFGWQETYSVALRAQIRSTSVVFLSERVDHGLAHLNDYLNHVPGWSGIIALVADGPYLSEVEQERRINLPNWQLDLVPFGGSGNIRLYNFTAIETPAQ